ncbi:MAG: hypothetical protein HFH67_08020 [Lachnospiraceae bacterium]|nr:hypothetical protein [Lachnospiraceae bacterium]
MVKNLFMKFSCLVFLAVIIINITDKFLMKETGNVIEKSENVIKETGSVIEETVTAKAAIIKNVSDNGSNLLDNFHPDSNTSTCVKEYTYTVEYNEPAFPQVHTITLEAGCTYGDILRGQMRDIIYSIRVTGKTMECPGNPILNSETESFLHVDTLSLRQVTVPNVAFISASIDGKVLNKSGSGYLCADNSINKNILGESLPIPVEFSNNGIGLDYNSIDLNSTYEGFVNGSGGMYVRSIKTKMQKHNKLTQIGDYFTVCLTIADFGNVPKDKDYHKAVWDIVIINAGNLSIQKKTIYQDIPVTIKD